VIGPIALAMSAGSASLLSPYCASGSAPAAAVVLGAADVVGVVLGAAVVVGPPVVVGVAAVVLDPPPLHAAITRTMTAHRLMTLARFICSSVGLVARCLSVC
jgi:hypothetical protein